jgi:perosamine synthetase
MTQPAANVSLIPVNEPLLGELERRYVDDCMATGWISSEGGYVSRFEEAWAEYCGVKHGVAISNGTTALFAAVAALRLQPGQELILPSFTIIGCALAAIEAGLTPVLVDCDPRTWCMDLDQVADRIGPRTGAVMAVHIYGHPVDSDALRKLCEPHGLPVVEDAAEAHGATVRGRRAGSLGDIGCFSFYANKIVTTGEGGMVVTDDAELAARVRSYRNMAFRPERRFLHTEIGYNHRLTNVQAAIGLGQVETIETRVTRKREIGRRYTELLSECQGISLPVEEPWAENVYWMYGLVVDEDTGHDAVSFAAALRERGVDTRPFFLGMHEQPVLRERGLFEGESYPVTERIARQGLYLPTGLTLTDDQIARVADAVRDALAA